MNEENIFSMAELDWAHEVKLVLCSVLSLFVISESRFYSLQKKL